jgi:hypothetical protein
MAEAGLDVSTVVFIVGQRIRPRGPAMPVPFLEYNSLRLTV